MCADLELGNASHAQDPADGSVQSLRPQDKVPARNQMSSRIVHRDHIGTRNRTLRDPAHSQSGWQAQRLAILMAMSVSEQMPLADVKNRLSEVVDRLEREHGRVVITKHGHPAAVVISVEDLESLEETLDVMGSAALLDDIREALAELGTSEPPALTKDDALRLIADR